MTYLLAAWVTVTVTLLPVGVALHFLLRGYHRRY